MLNKNTLFYVLLCLSFFGFSQNQKYYSLHLTKEYQKKQVSVYASTSDVFFFESGLLISKIPKGEIRKILVRNDKSTLYSTNLISKSNLTFNGSKTKSSFLTSRFTPTNKEYRFDKYLSIWVVLILVLLSIMKTQNMEVFVGFVVPWIAYTNTVEIIEKMNARAILLPLSFFLLCVFSLVWMFNPRYLWFDLIYVFGLILVGFVLKIIILNILEFLFDSRGFAKKYFLLFLKLGVFFSLFVFVLRFLEILNAWNFTVVYKYIIFLYVIVWFISLVLNFYRESRQKIMYFFSYICISEALPIVILIAFWKN